MLKSKAPVVCLLRNLSASGIQSRCASNTQRQSNMLAKLMTGKRKPKFKWTESLTSQKPKPMFEGKKTPPKVSTRRTIILNKMFMRHITDIIASGPIGYELSGLGLEITRVTVCQQYHGLNIFWTATGTDDFDSVEKKLESIQGNLRHELHQMQVMGNVPHLTFVRDTHLSYFDLLDTAIANADYGEDYAPNDPNSRFKEEFDIHGAAEPSESESESSIPPMRQDVFGVNHAVIMGRIKQSMAKSKQAWKAYDQQLSSPSAPKPFTFSTSFESIRQEQITSKKSEDILNEFLVKRKLLRKQQRAEMAEFNAAMMEEWNQSKDYEDEYESTEELFEDEAEFEQLYDNHDPYEK